MAENQNTTTEEVKEAELQRKRSEAVTAADLLLGLYRSQSKLTPEQIDSHKESLIEQLLASDLIRRSLPTWKQADKALHEIDLANLSVEESVMIGWAMEFIGRQAKGEVGVDFSPKQRLVLACRSLITWKLIDELGG
ncbi:Hypothetical protein PBC10988_23320 [Planctomycetales bacterium 10988]|nr:Hypothetical protein PBC10988_23320 [Planctomycetales bacterium 10988]